MSAAHRFRNVLGLLGAFVVASMVLGVLVAGLFLPAVGASGVTASKSVDFFNSLPGDLKQPPLPQQSKVLAADGSTIAVFFDQNRINVKLDAISEPMQAAVIAIEDSRFYHHGGVDPQGLMRAFLVNQFHKTVRQGASTLTQQYVKNVLLQSAYVRGDKAGQKAATADNSARKVKEIRYAVSLEEQMTKPEILNRYLNIAWFGGPNYGVEAAALHYFNTHAKSLTIPQAALLAGMIQSPVEWSPTVHSAAAKGRRNVVLQVMRDQGAISPAQFDKFSKQGLGIKVQDYHNGCANTPLPYGFYCDYVQRLIAKSDDFKVLGKTKEAREIALLRGGLTIKTNLSIKVQKAATKTVNDVVPARNSPGIGSAAVTVEPGTGKVLAIAENRKWDPSEKLQGHTSQDWAVDDKYGGSDGFLTGSTFKAFTLATWLKEGKSLNARVSSETGTAPFSAFRSCAGMDHSQSYTYSNSEGSGNGDISVFQATYASVNGAFVSMEKQLDLCAIADTAESFGVHLAKPVDDTCTDTKAPSDRIPRCHPSLTLGVLNLSPMTMAAAYAGFAAQGLYCKPVAVAAIIDRNGNNLKVPQQSCQQVLDKRVANTLTYGLSRVFSKGGTAAAVGPLPGGRQASGKTGTTNGSEQTWFCGYTPQLATAVWVGLYRGSGTLNGKKINGHVHYGHVFGATYAAPIWKRIMTTASNGTPKKRFPGPDSALTRIPTTAVPDVAGTSVKAAVAILKSAGFKAATNGGFVNSKFPAGRVAATSPAGGSRVQTGSTVQISISNGLNAPGGGKKGGGGGGLLGGLFPNGNG